MHFGVSGMHWGKRKYQNKDGSLTPEGRIHYGYESGGKKPDPLRARQIKKRHRVVTAEQSPINPNDPRNLKKLSDEDLRSITSRWQSEKNYLQAYNQLTEERAKFNQRQQSMVKKALKSVGKNTINTLNKGIIKPIVMRKIKRAINEKLDDNIFDLSKPEDYKKKK